MVFGCMDAAFASYASGTVLLAICLVDLLLVLVQYALAVELLSGGCHALTYVSVLSIGNR